MSRPLRSVATIHYGKSQCEVATEDGDVPILGTGGEFGRASRGLFTGPAILVPRKGSLGNPQYIEGPFWPVDTTYAVLPKADVSARWIYYSLALYDLTKLNEATGVPSINRNLLERVPLEDVTPTQQRCIAEILSTVDEAIEQTERLIAKQQQIKAGLMQDLFTRGVWTAASIERARASGSFAAATAKVGQLRPPREIVPELYKESPLGWIPKDWDIRRLSEIGKVVTGRTPPSNVPGVWGAGLPFVTPADFVHNAEIRIGERSVSGKGQTFVNLIPADSVLVVCIGSTIGKVSLVTQECATNQQINALVSFADKASVFTREAVTRNVYQLRKWMGLQAVPIVKKSQFEKLKIEWPDEGERTAIERYAKAHDDATDENQRTLEKLQKQKQGLMQDLLTGKVPVVI